MKRFLSVLLIFGLFVPFPVLGSSFDEEYKYEEAIAFLSKQGIINGYHDGNLYPWQNLSRAEFVEIVVKAVYNEEITGAGGRICFGDVYRHAWYNEYVCLAKKKGLIQGYPDGQFKPDQQINFVEAMIITLKAFNYDFEMTDVWYEGFLSEAYRKNLIPLDVRALDERITRGQMADMITRAIKYKSAELNFYLKGISGVKNEVILREIIL